VRRDGDVDQTRNDLIIHFASRKVSMQNNSHAVEDATFVVELENDVRLSSCLASVLSTYIHVNYLLE